MLVTSEDEPSDIPPEIMAWTKAKDRGGLTKPSSGFLELMVCFEYVLRQEVNVDCLDANSLATDKLKETVFCNTAVQEQWKTITGSTKSITFTVLEMCISLFLTIRGFAVVKLDKKRRQRDERAAKSSFSLRKSLDRKSRLRRLSQYTLWYAGGTRHRLIIS